MTTHYRLHCFKESGNSYKVALALALAGIEWEKVDVNYTGGETRQSAWRSEVNVMGEVPVLEVDGHRMTQSGAILLHLAEHTETLRLDTSERDETLRWLLFDNHKFTANLASYRWLRTFATPAPHEAVLEFLRQRVVGAFDIVERHLTAHPFMVAGRLTIADVSLAGYVFYPKEELGFDISVGYPRVWDWMQRIRQAPGWQAPYDLLA